jgi:hypothetical protein
MRGFDRICLDKISTITTKLLASASLTLAIVFERSAGFETATISGEVLMAKTLLATVVQQKRAATATQRETGGRLKTLSRF